MTKSWTRRTFLSAAAAAGLVRAQPSAAAVMRAHEAFSFLFVTDTHLQPELDAAHGCAMAFAKARALGGDFAIQGGDHVFDALGATRLRTDRLVSLYTRTEQDLGMAVHHTIGNDAYFGIYPASGAVPTDPFYGEKFFQDHFGRLYYSFDHRGVHFVVLDSIGITSDRD